ncbi:restriction endonuclease subunit S [Arthrobacter yangruifuii]|uniref:restriction endonuclease subunit S n=1 Tax=Arthrobacter yangruifuii TaxID=2606616 RepID=UPI0011B3CD6C|nr:restriction endonuclease subunit S [Arthrobacter yangruifuii]
MSHINDLIAELCPEGVRFETLGSLLQTSTNIRWTEHGDEKYRYIDLTSVDRITHSIANAEVITRTNAPSRAQQIIREGDVIFGTTRPMLRRYCLIPSQFDGQIASTGYCVLRPKKDRLLPNFLFHAIGTAEFYSYVEANERGASYPAIPDSVVKRYRVPVPPLEVQQEIVRVLDQFTQLEAELEAELEARRRQYEHYSHDLLTIPTDVDWIPLGKAVRNFDKLRRPITRSARVEGIYPYYGANGIQDYVHEFIFDGTFLLMGEDGSVKRADGTPVLNWATGKFWVNNHAHVLTVADDRFNLRFLYHYLGTIDISSYVTGGTQPKINQSNLNRIPVPLVSRTVQDEVAARLDAFDVLVNDLSSGLPAELAARRKQYEYYRDRLLTFKEAAV